METGRKDLFEQFNAITGCKTNRKIAHYLEACDFDLAMAVDLYFAQGGEGAENDDVAMLTDDDEELECIQSTSSSTSRPIAKVASKNGTSHYNGDEVRAPIPSTRGTMVEGSYGLQYGIATNGNYEGAFNQRPNNREAAIEQERNLRNALNHMNVQAELRGTRETNDHSSLLQNLFKPPTDISFNGSFESAKEVASEAGKWLLVNVQDLREFACQTLNRDIWSNEGVKELIRTNFLFWQVRFESVDGQRLKNYYKLKSYPAIFILDPRTGEMTNELVIKKQDPVTLCDYLTSYLDNYPDFYARDKQMKGELDGNGVDAFSPGNVPEYAAEPECSRSAMFQDEEMDRAPRKRKMGDEQDGSKKARMSADILNEPTRMLTVVDKDEWLQEVSQIGEVCKIKLKLPDGKIETIQVTNKSKLKSLFVFIAGRNLNPKDYIFVQSYPRREFPIESAEQTLSELGFSKNELLHVELK